MTEYNDVKQHMAQVSKIAAELSRARAERKLRRAHIAVIVLAALLIASNAAWLIVRVLP